MNEELYVDWSCGRLSFEDDVASFSCGRSMQDQFLKDCLSNPSVSQYARTTVFWDEEGLIAGYYTLSAAQVAFQTLPHDYLPSKLSYPVPAIRIGQLAVDKRWQGRGIAGKALLGHAIGTILDIYKNLGVVLVTLDVEEDNEPAKNLYRRLGFTSLPKKQNTFVRKLDSCLEEYQSDILS